MERHRFWLSNKDNSVDLPGAQVIGISPTALSERQHGESVIRFRLAGDAAMGAEPYDSVVAWYQEDTKFSLELEEVDAKMGSSFLELGDAGKGECSVRECDLNIESRTLYISIYVPSPAQQVRHWFSE